MGGDIVSPEGPLLTLDEFERLPDDGWRCELVRGRVLREPPAGFDHGCLAGRIVKLLGRFVEDHNLGEVVTAETGFVLFEDPPTVRAPDAAFVATDRMPSERVVGFARFAPDLVVEIVSPSNTASEIRGKVLDYLEAGTRLVWVVDPGTRTATVYRSKDEIRIIGEEDELDGGDVLPGLRVQLSELFAVGKSGGSITRR